MPAKDKDLQPVDDLKMVQRYLKYGLEFHEIVSCYIEDVDLRFDASIKSVDMAKLIIEMDIDKDDFAKLPYDTLSAVDRPQSAIRLSYSVNEATFFIHAKMQGRSARRIVVKAEMPMYKLQRREAMRIKVLDSHKATIKLGPEILPIFDISAGGICIVIGLDEEKNYQKGKTYPGSHLKFLGQEIKVDLEVKNLLPMGKDGLKWKVGFRFKALPATFEQLIVREAYLHTHKIWSRWL